MPHCDKGLFTTLFTLFYRSFGDQSDCYRRFGSSKYVSMQDGQRYRRHAMIGDVAYRRAGMYRGIIYILVESRSATSVSGQSKGHNARSGCGSSGYHGRRLFTGVHGLPHICSHFGRP